MRDVKPLKQCPFCGSKNVEERRIAGIPMFECRNLECGALVSFNNDDVRVFPRTAAMFWNERVSDNERTKAD